MPDLLWPGDERAGQAFTDASLLDAMVRVEEAWLSVLAERGLAPVESPLPDLSGLVGPADLDELATGAEATGNPVVGLVALLRSRLREAGREDAATWLHRGLTSQDVVDSALALCLADTMDRVEAEVAAQAGSLARLAREHRDTLMAGRTLTQHAVPVTFGLTAATWLDGLGAAATALRAARAALPAQVGGAAGTLSAVVELAAQRGLDAPEQVTLRAAADLAERIGLAPSAPWHGNRGVLTRAADALVGVADVWGRIAGQVTLLSRPELGELREEAVAGRGGSSTMPHKANPVLSVLVRRHALGAPPLAATLHTAAATFLDERPDGAWHAEWDALRSLARRSVAAASQVSELLGGLRVDADRMRETAMAAHDDLRAEQRNIAKLAGGEPRDTYRGVSAELVEAALTRAATVWKELL